MPISESKAFVSYSRADSEFALRLAADLKTAGASIWLDQLDIEPGTAWDSSIEEALLSSSHMLVILSTVSVASDNVRDEISYALSQQMKVIPVLYDECKVPFRLARLQHIDFRNDYNSALQSLLRTLHIEHAAQQAATLPDAPQPASDAVAEATEHQSAVEQARLQSEREQRFAEYAKWEEANRKEVAQQSRLKLELEQQEQAEASQQVSAAERQSTAPEPVEQNKRQNQQINLPPPQLHLQSDKPKPLPVRKRRWARIISIILFGLWAILFIVGRVLGVAVHILFVLAIIIFTFDLIKRKGEATPPLSPAQSRMQKLGALLQKKTTWLKIITLAPFIFALFGWISPTALGAWIFIVLIVAIIVFIRRRRSNRPSP